MVAVTETYSRHILILVFLYAIVASNWDFPFGFGGIVNFAHLAFFALGLYTYGILAKILAGLVEQLNLGEPMVFGWSLGGYVALECAARSAQVPASTNWCAMRLGARTVFQPAQNP